MAQTPAPNSMEAIYYADIELPETVARNLYRRGQELETVNAALLAALEIVGEVLLTAHDFRYVLGAEKTAAIYAALSLAKQGA